jgi:hypothetical protein
LAGGVVTTAIRNEAAERFAESVASTLDLLLAPGVDIHLVWDETRADLVETLTKAFAAERKATVDRISVRLGLDVIGDADGLIYKPSLLRKILREEAAR